MGGVGERGKKGRMANIRGHVGSIETVESEDSSLDRRVEGEGGLGRGKAGGEDKSSELEVLNEYET